MVDDDDEEGVEPYPNYPPKFENTTDLVAEHVEVGTQLGADGSVLLKNTDSALPLSGSEKVSVFGSASTATAGHYGMNSGANVSGDPVTISAALTSRGVSVNTALDEDNESKATKVNVSGSFTGATSEILFNPVELTTDTSLIGSYTDVGIVVIGRDSSESADYFPGSLGIDTSSGARNPLALTNDERALITTAEQYCSKVIVLINACNPMEIGEIVSDSNVDAILWVGFPGIYGYYGVADVLLGKTNPSGRLADTYANDSTSSPAMQNFGLYKFSNIDDYSMESNDKAGYYVVEAESIYTGYKYYETRYEDAVLGQGNASSTEGAFDSASGWTYGEEVSYSFGEGLSYTTFEQKITDAYFREGYRTAEVEVEVTNTGKVAGRSVVQVYGQSPYTSYDKQYGVEKASVQLLNYEKTGMIEPGKSESVTVEIDMQLLASYDTDGKGTYIMEAGDYYFALGCNDNQEGAHAAVNNVLAAKGKTPANTGNVMDAGGDVDATFMFTWDEAYEDIFSESKAEVEVTNQFADADLNYWNCGTTVSYLSRNDWTWGNSWNENDWSDSNRKGYAGVKVTDAMVFQLSNDTYEIQTGEDVSGIKFNQDNGLPFGDMTLDGGSVVDYDDEMWNQLLDQLDLVEAINFIMSGNRTYLAMESVGFLAGTYTENGPSGLKTTGTSGDAPWILNDDGSNSSYQWNDCGCAILQASTFDKDLIERLGEMWGNDGLYSSIPIIWGPSINCHRSPYNGRTAEYYSEDPILSGYSAVAVCKGSEKYGMLCAIKHFAFNDSESNRNGVAPFFDEQKVRENELRGFQIAFEGGAKATMTAFNRVGCTYASADMGLMSGVLRGEWDFKGYAVSDMINPGMYMTFTESVLAGTTNFDTTSWQSAWGADSAEAYASMISGDATMLQAIKDSVHQSLWAFAHTSVTNFMVGNAHTEWVANWWRVTYITLEVVGGVVACAALVLYVVAEVVGKKKDDGEEE